ncbi:uncharacterized protein LOC106766571 [Vigna radiata var. radiata]|uniref:Uncharacterized protein LOC106766571 n=1 Tax=Vigna radiata var. radiata TaxID=3916 RepID=A0A1S3UL46_VIGRR|nr:uncharacterized protein LOC106766571 [Vigna radiata var. radiata]
MGNCCVAASSMEWDGEDWSDLKTKKVFDGKVQKEKLMGAVRASPDGNGKVKMVISKKELAQLLIGKKTNSAEAVLLSLIKARYQDSPHHLWRPVLETIPEGC